MTNRSSMTLTPHPHHAVDDTIPQAPDSEELQQLIAWRRVFHQYPEIRWTEFWTTAKIVNILEEFGFETLYGRSLYQQIEQQGMDPLDLRKTVPESEVMDQAYSRAMERLGSEHVLSHMQGGLTGVVARIKGTAALELAKEEMADKKVEETGMADEGSEHTCRKKFGFRFDIDGLPIVESRESDHHPFLEGFAATNGNMHACGHDGHIVMGLGLAKRIAEHIDELSGEYWIIFQPGEEGGMGGQLFSHLPFLTELDHFITTHLGLIEERKLICGLAFMDANAYSVEFRGRSTHSAVAPNQGRNALQAACTAVTNLYGIPRHGDGASRVNVGEFHSSNVMNIISDKATFTFQTRGENPIVAEHMDLSAKRILESAAQMFDVEVTIRPEGKYISARNDDELRSAIMEVGQTLGIGQDAIIDVQKLPGSEDAPYLMQKVQDGGGEAVFMGLGCGTRGGHHNPSFDFDEDLMYWGVAILWRLIQKSL